MAIADTHQAVKQLQKVGFEEAQAEEIVRVVGVGQNTVATKADLEGLAQANKADLEALAQANRADLEALAQKTSADMEALASKADLEALAQKTSADIAALAQKTEADLEKLELRLRHDLTVRMGAMIFAAAGAQVAIVIFLLTQFFAN